MNARFVRGAMAGAFAIFAVSLAMGGPAAAQPIPGEEHCVVNIAANDALNLRFGPGTSFPVQATLGPAVCGILVTGPCAGNWCPVEDGHHAGWVHARYIAPISPALYCVTGVAFNDVLNLRTGPSTQYAILTGLAPNQCGIAFLPYSSGNWQKIRVGGWEGWVNRRFVSGQ